MPEVRIDPLTGFKTIVAAAPAPLVWLGPSLALAWATGAAVFLLFAGSTCKLGRLVVARDARRRGVGARLLAHAEREARAAGAERIVLNAQTRARGVYRSSGYAERGETFIEAGIEHVRMERPLA